MLSILNDMFSRINLQTRPPSLYTSAGALAVFARSNMLFQHSTKPHTSSRISSSPTYSADVLNIKPQLYSSLILHAMERRRLCSSTFSILLERPVPVSYGVMTEYEPRQAYLCCYLGPLAPKAVLADLNEQFLLLVDQILNAAFFVHIRAIIQYIRQK